MNKFAKQLAKGFVRSAVNQVGRDGGKVISNKVYGDRHSKPVRVVGNNQYENSDGSPLNFEWVGEPEKVSIVDVVFLKSIFGLILPLFFFRLSNIISNRVFHIFNYITFTYY